MYENVPFGCKAFTGGLAKVMMATPSCPTSIVALGAIFASVSQSTFVCHKCLMVFVVRGRTSRASLCSTSTLACMTCQFTCLVLEG